MYVYKLIQITTTDYTVDKHLLIIRTPDFNVAWSEQKTCQLPVNKGINRFYEKKLKAKLEKIQKTSQQHVTEIHTTFTQLHFMACPHSDIKTTMYYFKHDQISKSL